MASIPDSGLAQSAESCSRFNDQGKGGSYLAFVGIFVSIKFDRSFLVSLL